MAPKIPPSENVIQSPQGFLAPIESRFNSKPRAQYSAVETRAGFTLVELLVVISIIAILAGIAMPAMSGMRVKANRTKCLSNLRQLTAASIAYAGEHEGEIPDTNFTTGVTWYSLANQYLDSKKTLSHVFQCPSRSGTTATNLSWNNINYAPYTIAKSGVSNIPQRITNCLPSKAPWLSDSNYVATGGIWDGTSFNNYVVTPTPTGKPDSATLKWHGDGVGSELSDLTKGGLCVSFWDGHVDYLINPVCGFDNSTQLLTIVPGTLANQVH